MEHNYIETGKSLLYSIACKIQDKRGGLSVKKRMILILIFSLMIFQAACGGKSSATFNKESETVVPKQEPASASDQTSEQETAATADELLDLFINGTINAVDSADLTSTFGIADLNMDSEEWDSYSIGEKTDLDNDGENELVICGPYGGMYLDARDNKVYEFAAGDGSALTLSYTVYNGSVWILYSNNMNAGYESYHMELFEGADNLVAEMNFSEELIDENNPESGMKYTLNGSEISYEEYAELGSRIFAAQVNTN